MGNRYRSVAHCVEEASGIVAGAQTFASSGYTRSATSMDQLSRALVACSVSKIGEVSFGRTSGATCFERSTAASALGKYDAPLLLVKGIESYARPRSCCEPHRPTQRDPVITQPREKS